MRVRTKDATDVLRAQSPAPLGGGAGTVALIGLACHNTLFLKNVRMGCGVGCHTGFALKVRALEGI